ncbi:SpoIIE family protein phosphatase [Pedobacter sp. MC2016-15]|uniref:SpoIIE family protein phosphatase n=1 Tax=Pedobacter sp. MC2016-15 TaxID=2994473 RepID=UPI0022486257|nr:SpoIIE family protein phosphatase [Pedobacter sp. MC2016-15]MCX2480837.1 SpoIIE family protein phosphatase [Pedobacter sp. MC2016-15]
MVDATHKSFSASDRSYFAIIKKEIHNLASSLNFDLHRIAELDIIVAEITSNLHKYANGGELLVGGFEVDQNCYIELICIDNGPGMTDLTRMMSDGYSSSSTMGHGFGSIKRLSDEFDIFSSKGWGTILVSRVFKTPIAKKVKKGFEIRPLVVAKPGESTSGDGFYVKTTADYIKILVGDGLGHGPEANHAVNEAVKAFKQCPEHSPVEILRFLHTSVRKTRGLVATVAVIDTKTKQMRIAGVGNISTKLSGFLASKSHLSYNGIVGHNIPNTMNDQILDLKEYNLLTMCSDGMKSRWDINRFPSLIRADLSIQAAAIYKDFARLTDDMSVITAKF